MKLICVFVVTMIAVIQLSCGEDLKCEFKDQSYGLRNNLYTCDVTLLVNPNNNMTISGYSGVHLTNGNDNDVKGIYIHSTNTKYIPANLGSVFNLTILKMRETQLTEIKSSDFHGMQELEYLFLSNNILSSIPVDVFSSLTKLEIINLSSNLLQELPRVNFDNNLNLEQIHLDGNKIKYIAIGLFDGLKKLIGVNLGSNICLTKRYGGKSDIAQLKQDIRSYCIKPIEVQLIEFEEKINNLEKKLLEAKAVIRREQQEKVKAQNEYHLKAHQCEANQQILLTNMSMCHGFNSFNINCVFHIEGDDYSCNSQGLTINHRDMELIEVVGTHRRLRSNHNVTELVVTNSTTSFWSHKVFKTFPALQSLYIHNSQLKELIKGDFSFASKLTFLEVHGNEIRILGNQVFEGAEEHLTEIEMNSNQIETILINTFQGLKQLKKLSLKDNLISKFQTETFKELINLQTLNLASNKLQTLDGKLLQFNKKLRYLYLQQNNINGIGEEILNYSLELKTVDFSDNKCIDEKAKGKDDVDSIVDDIKTHCNLFGNCDYWTSIFEILI